MKAKKVYETIEDVFKPKTEKEILSNLSKYSIKKYIENKEGIKSSLKGKPLEFDPLIVQIFYKAREKGYPVKNLKGSRTGISRGEFKLTLKDKRGRWHNLTIYQEDRIFILDYGYVPMNWIHVMDYTSGGIGHIGGRIYNFEEFEKLIKEIENKK